MTRKELLEKAMTFQKVPRVPVVTMSGATWALKQADLSPDELMAMPDAGAKVLYDNCERLNLDLIYGGRAIPHIIMKGMGGVLNNSRKGLPGEIVKKPLDDIEQIHDWIAEKVMENLRADEEYQRLMMQIREVAKLTGEQRFVGVGSFGPFTTAGQMIGVQDFCIALTDEDYEEDVKALLELSAEVVYQVTADSLQAGGNLIFIAEPVASGDLISEEYFEKYSLPYLIQLKERLQELCPYMILHICGRTKSRITALKDSGITVFSMDSIDLKEALELAEGKITIMGNLNPVNVLERSSAEEVHRLSSELVKTAGLDGGFLLAPGCDLTPATSYENILAMVSAVY